MSHKPNFSVLEVGPRMRGEPWVIAFVYAPRGNFLVKGGLGLVIKTIAECWPVCLYNTTFWRNGRSWNHWSTKGIKIDERHPLTGDKSWDEYQMEKFSGASKSAKYAIFGDYDGPKFFYRRLPKKWLPEWNTLQIVKGRSNGIVFCCELYCEGKSG
ncbi:MAG: hypothetical protein WC390_10200 [Sulfurimonas sp.]